MKSQLATEHPHRSSSAPSIAIIGAGFGGLGMAIRAREAGFGKVTIFEARDGVGGVWRANTYPGAACDAPSHLYSFSFALNPDWSRKFCAQPEILAYLESIADRYGLRSSLRLGTRVVRSRWDEDDAHWELTTDAGELHVADVLVAATGQLRIPSYPPLPGRECFGGTQFHSAEWKHDHDLTGERVAVIGTGASAIQFVPEIVDEVDRLTVFQRSAPWVMPKPDRSFTDAEKARFRRWPQLMKAYRGSIFLRFEARFSLFGPRNRGAGLIETIQQKVLDATIDDPDLRTTLMPTDPPGCKRLLISNGWYQALDQPDVEVVTDPVAAITPAGARTESGREIDFDTLIWGTGFRASDFLVPMEVIGRDGRLLHDEWSAGAEAFLGISVAGYPNFFMLYGPNTNLGHNSIVYMIESQISYVTQACALLAEPDVRSLDVRPDIAERFNTQLQTELGDTVWASGCDSWYTTADGRNTQNWSNYASSYRRRVRRFEPADFRVGRSSVLNPVPAG